MPNAALLVPGLILLGGSALAETTRPEIVEIRWSEDGSASAEFQIAPGRIVEWCSRLAPGQSVQWQFDSTEPLNFNVHYHDGVVVRAPARLRSVARSSGVLDVSLERDYCWTWTNRSAAATTSLKAGLRKTKREAPPPGAGLEARLGA
ncbi:MAG: hypothetical protein AB7L76_06965 [Burkholderiaceae bacterium]